jgi:sarcosine oxidase subunit gamma
MSEQAVPNDAVRESPLLQFFASRRGTRSPAEAGVSLGERAFQGHVNLRGDPADAAFLDAVQGVLGVGLPTQPNTVAEGDGVASLWLGPDEWLLITPPSMEARLADGLRDALGDTFAAVTDVSGGQTVITIQGPHARDVLAKGCSLDLHPRVFSPGLCAQTLVAGVGAIIRQIDEKPSYDLIVRRSLAEYLAHWLEDAAQEYGLEVVGDGGHVSQATR